jgi:pre-mRNA-splicing helicase BRR2
LEVVSSSAEFESVPIRRHEDTLLRRIYDRVPVKLDQVDFEAPHFKTFLLLQAHFSRLQLPPDLAADQVLVLEKVLNLLSACVDVMSSNAWLNALGAMDLSQMCVQAMWETDSPLKQIPHFEPDVSSPFLNCRYETNSCYFLGYQEMQRRWYRIRIRRYGNGGRSAK